MVATIKVTAYLPRSAPQVYLYSEEIEYLERRVATQTQYLVVKHRDGRKENVPG